MAIMKNLYFQQFEDALEEIPEKNTAASKKHSTSSKEKVVKKLSKLKMKDKSIKNGDPEDNSCQVLSNS